MENQRPLILISNDDGIIAKGISELMKFSARWGDCGNGAGCASFG